MKEGFGEVLVSRIKFLFLCVLLGKVLVVKYMYKKI